MQSNPSPVPVTQTPLSGVERVNRMLGRCDHDRVPRYESFWPQTIEKWTRQGLQGGLRGAYDLLSSDIHQLAWFEPQPYPGQNQLVENDAQTQIVVDGFGATLRIWKSQGGTPEHLAFGCTTPDEWMRIFKPALLKIPVQVDPERLRSEARYACDRNRWAMLGTIEGYEFIKRLIGDEVALIAMATDPHWIRDIASTYTDVLLQNLEVAFEHLPVHGVFLSADMAYNHAPLFSPQMYRELLMPDHQRIIDFIHQYGAKVIFHTDGQVTPLVPHYLELGIDSLHPLENAAGMDLASLVQNFGDRLSFWGNQDKRIWQCGDREAIAIHVRRRLDHGMSRQGYGFHSDHSVQPDIDLATYRFIVDLVDQYGAYD